MRAKVEIEGNGIIKSGNLALVGGRLTPSRAIAGKVVTQLTLEHLVRFFRCYCTGSYERYGDVFTKSLASNLQARKSEMVEIEYVKRGVRKILPCRWRRILDCLYFI